MHVCIYIHIYIYMRTHIHTHTHTHIYIYIYKYIIIATFRGHLDAALLDTQIKGTCTKCFGPFSGFWLFWCYPPPPSGFSGLIKNTKTTLYFNWKSKEQTYLIFSSINTFVLFVPYTSYCLVEHS